MPKSVMFTIVENGYDIGEVNKYISDSEALMEAFEEQTGVFEKLSKERDELFRNCVVFAKRIKSLEKQLSGSDDTFFEQEEATEYAVPMDEDEASIRELPFDAANYDELFNLLNGIENETSSYVNDFKSSIETSINQVVDMAKSILEYANAEKKRILEVAYNDAEKILNENRAAKIRLAAAHKQLGEILTDLDAVVLKDA